MREIYSIYGFHGFSISCMDGGHACKLIWIEIYCSENSSISLKNSRTPLIEL
jgi:hypothetical protein